MNYEKLFNRVISLSVVLSGITMLLYAYLGTFMRAFGDDWCIASRSLDTNPFAYVAEIYTMWSGRYTEAFLSPMINRMLPVPHMWMTQLFVVIYVCAFYYAASQFLRLVKIDLNHLTRVGIAIILTFTFYRIMPSYQHIFWVAALIPYSIPMFVITFWFGSVCQYFSEDRSSRDTFIFVVWSALVMLFLGGMTEAIVLFIGFVLFLMLCASPAIPKSHRREYMIIVFLTGTFAAIALAIVLLSPGSWERRAIGEATEGFTVTPLEALPGGVAFTLAYVFGEFLGITFGQTYGIAFFGFLFLLGFLWGIFYLDRNPQVMLPAPKSLSFSALLVLIGGILCVFVVIYPVVYAGRGNLPLRPLSVPRYTQLAMVLMWLYLALASAQRHNLLDKLREQRTWPVVLVFVSFLLVWIPATSIYRLAQFVPDFADYTRSWDERHQFLLGQSSDAEVVYPGLDYYIEDEFLIVRESFSAGNSKNRCISTFYGIQSFSIEGGVEPPFIQ